MAVADHDLLRPGCESGHLRPHKIATVGRNLNSKTTIHIGPTSYLCAARQICHSHGYAWQGHVSRFNDSLYPAGRS
jgi:hypothetical protein